MKSELSFEAWTKAVVDKVKAAGISFEVDSEMMYMAYDMEEKSVDEAAAEIIESLN